MERICEDFSLMVSGGYLSGACEADVKFHEAIIEGSKNARLLHIYKSSNIPLFHFQLGSAQSEMNDYELTDVEHRKIVKALKKKDYETARETLIMHLDRGEKAMLGMVPTEHNTVAG